MDDSLHFNWSFLGNQALVQYLQGAILKRTYAHAYLFVGPKQAGRRTLVQTFIQSILCAEFHRRSGFTATEIPCGRCIHCKQCLRGVHPDIVPLTREKEEKNGKEKQNIGIEQVRDLQTKLASSALLDLYKFAVIEDAEALTGEAVNGLLKTLEEPKRHIILCLIAEQREALLPTLVSRCQVFPVRRVSTKLLLEWLQQRGIPMPEAITIAKLASGLPGRAAQLSTDNELYKEYQNTVRDFLALCETGLLGRLKRADDILKKGESDHGAPGSPVSRLFEYWSEILADILLLKHSNGGENHIRNVWCIHELSALSKKFTDKKLISLLEYLEEARVKLRSNINVRLLLDHFFIYL